MDCDVAPFYYISYNIFYKYIYKNIVKFKGFPLMPPVYCLYFLHYITVFYNISFVKVFCYLCYLCFVIYAFLLFGSEGEWTLSLVVRHPERGGGAVSVTRVPPATLAGTGSAGQRAVRHPSAGFWEGVPHSSGASPGERPRPLTQPVLCPAPCSPPLTSPTHPERSGAAAPGTARPWGSRGPRAGAIPPRPVLSCPARPCPLPSQPAPARSRSRPPRREPHAAGPAPRRL